MTFLYKQGIYACTIFILTSILQGCAPNAVQGDNSQLRDSDMTVGCYTIEGMADFDSYFNTTKMTAEVCKLKCSEFSKLPKNFYYQYDNDRTGCHHRVGVKLGEDDNE